MAAKTSWHRYGTKLRHCHPMYKRIYCERITDVCKLWCQSLHFFQIVCKLCMEYFCSSCKFEIPVRSCSSQQNSFPTSIKSASHDQLTTPLQQPASVQLPIRSAVKCGTDVKAGGGGNGRLWKRCGLPGAGVSRLPVQDQWHGDEHRWLAAWRSG